MSTAAFTKREKIQVAICFLLWGYIIYRAFFIAITQDEAHTYLLVKTNNWRQALTTANTHWLNSFFIKLFLWLPGADDVWKVRLLPVLSWSVYSFSTIRLSSCFKNKWLGLAFFIIAVFNPFLIFYFSLGRGYGPACAFIMLSLWLAARRMQDNETTPRKWMYVFVAASVATLANFSAFYFFAGLTGVFLFYLWTNKKVNLIFQPAAGPWLLLVAVTTLLTSGALFLVRWADNLWFPGKSNMVDSLFGSLIQGSSYFHVNTIHYKSSYYHGGVSFLLREGILTEYRVAGIILFFLFLVACLYLLFLFVKAKKWTLASLALFSCAGIVFLNVFLHLFFKTPYLFIRTTLILYPPLVLGLFLFADGLMPAALWRKMVVVLFPLLLLAAGYNFYKSFSLDNFLEWPVQTDTQKSLDYLNSAGAKRVGINKWHAAVLSNYYLKAYPGKYSFNYQAISEREQADLLSRSRPSNFDYLLLAPPYNDSVLLKGWIVELSFPESGTKVLKNDSLNRAY